MQVHVLSKTGRRELLDAGRQVKRELLEIADNLDEHHKNVNISRVTGGAAGVVGAGMAIVGLVGIPFTFGASSALIAGGAALGAAGGATTIGAELTGYFIKKSKEGDVKKAWETMKNKFLEHLGKMPEGDLSNISIVLEGSNEFVAYTKKAVAGQASLQFVKRGVPYAIDAGMALDEAALAVGFGSSVVGAASVTEVVGALARPIAVLNIFAMGVSIYDIIDASIELGKNQGSPASVGIRKLVDHIVVFLKKLENL